MTARALSDDKMRHFLRRKRQESDYTLSVPPLGRFLADALETATRLVPSTGGCVLLDDPKLRNHPETSPLTVVAASGPVQRGVVGSQIECDEGIEAQVYNSGRSASRNVGDGGKYVARIDHLVQSSNRSLIATPIRLEREVCGVLVLFDRQEKENFSDQDMEIVDLLAGYLSRAVLNAVDIIKQNEMAMYDSLTGLYNVRGLMRKLDKLIEAADRSGADLSVLFVDLDKLKQLNDRFGHQYGSEAIRRTALALNDTVGDRGTVFRFGGDEFVVVCPNTDLENAEYIAEALTAAVRRQTPGPMPGGKPIPVMTVSIGIATLHSSLKREKKSKCDGPSRSARLLTVADRALYRAKNKGRDRSAKALTADDTILPD